jgi:F-type H+-transporting ATPase subunit delta
VRQAIRGFTDAVMEQAADTGALSRIAAELAGVLELIDTSQDLRRALTDPGVPVPARRAVVTDLLEARVSPVTLRLVVYAVETDRATDFREDVAWLAPRIDAAAHDMRPVGDVVLGRRAAEERLDGYASSLLEQVTGRGGLDTIEDELFRFMRIVGGSEELRDAVTNRSRDLSPADRRSLVVDLLQGEATPTTVQLAAYATYVGRPRDYEALLAHLVERVAAESDRRLADVRAPIEIDDGRRRHLAEALSRVAGHTVEVRVTVDPAVLGGFVATIGDTVVDGSARHRLDLLKERLLMPEAEITTGDLS